MAFCKVRAESSTKLSTFANSVGDFADGVTDIIQHGDPANPNVIRLGGLSLDLSVAARSYQPVTFDECMAATAAP